MAPPRTRRESNYIPLSRPEMEMGECAGGGLLCVGVFVGVVASSLMVGKALEGKTQQFLESTMGGRKTAP